MICHVVLACARMTGQPLNQLRCNNSPRNLCDCKMSPSPGPQENTRMESTIVLNELSSIECSWNPTMNWRAFGRGGPYRD